MPSTSTTTRRRSGNAPAPARKRMAERERVATEPLEAAGHRRGALSLADRAYERLEELLVCCELEPGRFLATHELQAMVGYGRTPVLQAVNRLAADTLVAVTPRHGLRISPIDLGRDRVLLRLRRDMERFVIQLATERSGASQRNQLLHLKRQLLEHREGLTLAQFNQVDRHIDQLLLTAAGEPFVESTLRPLHTIFRRLGWIYHMRTPQGADLSGTVDNHVAVIDSVASGKASAAIKASDRLMDHVEAMFDVLEREVQPSLLDCSLGDLDNPFALTAAQA